MRRHDILLMYYQHSKKDAMTVQEHIDSFSKCSQFKVLPIDVQISFPAMLSKLEFNVIVLHYSIFGYVPLRRNTNNHYYQYIKGSKNSYKIAFCQDEYYFCQERWNLLNGLGIDCVYTLVEPQYFKDTYRRYTSVPKLIYTIPGFVSDQLMEKARKFAKRRRDRAIDIGYRARRLPYHLGVGAQEKAGIADRFQKIASSTGLRVDIDVDEKSRLYGNAWYEFLGNCRACLGVEAGVSLFDSEDVIRLEYEKLIAQNPKLKFEDMPQDLMAQWDNKVQYRMISPRHFEAAAFRVVQVLYEGKYSNILKPMVHYIPLKKDFSNVPDVLVLLNDEDLCAQITENAYRDLIASRNYSYHRFFREFDQELTNIGLVPQEDTVPLKVVRGTLRIYADILAEIKRRLVAWAISITASQTPVLSQIISVMKPILRANTEQGATHMTEKPTRLEYFNNYALIARDEMKQDIMPVFYKEAQAAKIISYCGNTSDQTILDIGIGKGILLKRVQSKRKVGVDISIDFLKLARGYGVEAIWADAEMLPFREAFDLIFMTDILEHVINPLAALESAKKALKRGGTILIRVPNQEKNLEKYKELPYKFVHLRTFDKTNLAALIEQSGLHVRRMHYDGFSSNQARCMLLRRISQAVYLLSLPYLRKRLKSCSSQILFLSNKLPVLQHLVVLILCWQGIPGEIIDPYICRFPNRLGNLFFKPYEIAIEVEKP